jgi:phosphatidylglycerol:prolipoprotein diacylglycerol transferase
VLPVLFDSAYFTLYAYPLFMGLAWGFGYFFTQYLFEKQNEDSRPLRPLFVGVFFTSFLGAKLFFLWFSSGYKLYQYIYANYFWFGGGFVFYGGLLFGLFYYLLYSLYFKKFDFKKSSLLLPGLIFGHAIGRLGCFMAGCCYGEQTTIPWGIPMNGVSRHPVQLYETLALSLLGLIILKMLKAKKDNLTIISSYLLSYSLIRFILEFFRGDEIRGLVANNLSTSQLVSIVVFALGLAAIKMNKRAISALQLMLILFLISLHS